MSFMKTTLSSAPIATIDPDRYHSLQSVSPDEMANHTEVPASMKLCNTLILLGCSATKRPTSPGEEMPLIDLYDGPLWRTLRTHLGRAYYRVGRHGHTPAHVTVLSGKYGITNAGKFSRTYEARLSKEKADQVIRQGLLGLQYHFGEINPKNGSAGSPLCHMKAPCDFKGPRLNPPWNGIIVCGGEDYRRVFLALLKQLIQRGNVAPDAAILVTKGGIGEQRAQLGRWVSAVVANSEPLPGIWNPTYA